MGLNVFADSNIIIYFLERNERFFSLVEPYFKKCQKKELVLFTSSLSFMEVLVPIVSEGNRVLQAKYNYLFKDFLKIIDIDLNVAEIGAYIKARYRIKTPNALQIACAKKANCNEFLTADAGIEKIKEIKIKIIK
ncbi:MAG: type II toxin-antitoxin system VapC family toxin [Deltaproteobacteria bacterium]|nr:type II toxin-antitoxin system VapC family toxin [Deltaproteobacteria bacterium]